jgi:hypothetical protein
MAEININSEHEHEYWPLLPSASVCQFMITSITWQNCPTGHTNCQAASQSTVDVMIAAYAAGLASDPWQQSGQISINEEHDHDFDVCEDGSYSVVRNYPFSGCPQHTYCDISSYSNINGVTSRAWTVVQANDNKQQSGEIDANWRHRHGYTDQLAQTWARRGLSGCPYGHDLCRSSAGDSVCIVGTTVRDSDYARYT